MEKILLVDDEPDVLSSIRESLESQGYEVLTAQNGISALELIRNEVPRLILLDLMLPGLDGYRILKLLKGDQRYREIPVIVITARADTQDLTLATECGAESYFVKPLKVDALVNRILHLFLEGKMA